MNAKFEEIKRLFEAECRATAPLTSASQLPIAYERITPAWLTDLLAKGHPGAEVTACSLGPVDDGTSSRRRIFITWNEAGKKARLPASVFCKGSMRLESRYMLALNGGIEAEVAFYRVVRPHLPIEAPEAYLANIDHRSFNSIIVMRDLGGEVKFCPPSMEQTLEGAKSQMRLLATLHGRYYESPELSTTLSPFNTWETYFTVTVEEAGFGESCPRGFTMAEAVIPPRLFRRAAEIWPATLRCVAMHADMPRTLVHSDVHLKNWYVAKNGEMGLNDWQCSCKGNWGRDLAYAISTAFSIEDRRRHEKETLRYYLDRLHAAGGPKLSFEDAFRIYRQQLFSALAWWTGTLGQPPEAPEMQPAETSLEFIKRMAHAIDDLDALDSF